jgi:hypothetical protein
VIEVINFIIEKGQKKQSETVKTKKGTVERIRVNDATATGGWW